MLDSWIIDDGRGLTRPQASRRLVETALSSYALRPGTRLRSPVALGANSGYGLANDCLLVSTEVDPGFWTSGLGGADAVPF